MFVFDVVGTEAHAAYQSLSVANLDRQYGFLRSVVDASIALNRSLLSIEVIKALNYHAISCLHAYAGEFRPCPVTVGQRVPPQHYQVPALMNMFVDEVNRYWDRTDPVQLAAYVLWRINYVHPFVNGNGRAARAACYFVLCLKSGGLLGGDPILPELIRANRPAYVAALQLAHQSLETTGAPNLSLLHALLSQLVSQQLASAVQPAAAPPTPADPGDAATALGAGTEPPPNGTPPPA
ncbi:MAG TPA: Fic family protein [Rhizomicrobium sp.]